MNIGIILICRYSSSRLPGKILSEIAGRPVIRHIVERIQRGAGSQSLVVATSADPSDDPIAAYCRQAGLECFRGSLFDVAGRFLSCMQAYEFDFGVRINGDRVFLDSSILNAMLGIVETDQFDFVTNLPGKTFPSGMTVEIVRRSWYERLEPEMVDPVHREHVTNWLYENPELGKRFTYRNQICPEAAGLQLALDTPGDFEYFSTIFSQADVEPSSLSLQKIYEIISRPSINSPWRGESGPLLIAEIGGNHDGDFETAKIMCQLAIDSGVDCVKFQLYLGDSLVSAVEAPDRHKHFQKFELTREHHIELAEMCQKAGVIYCASVWDLEMLEWIDQYLDFYKVGSGDLTAWPLLKEFVTRGKPILLSTGLATMEEVLQTVDFIQRENQRYLNPEMLCIMQCTSMYPIPDQDANLRVMDSYRSATGLAVGYSDHTRGDFALSVAASMGASVLEFHFTESREGKTFRDHAVSLTAPEVKELKRNILRITELRGEDLKRPTQSEIQNQHGVSFRRAVYLRNPVSRGEQIKEEDLIYLRPLHGTDPRDMDLVLGSRALRDLKPFQQISYKVDYE